LDCTNNQAVFIYIFFRITAHWISFAKRKAFKEMHIVTELEGEVETLQTKCNTMSAELNCNSCRFVLDWHKPNRSKDVHLISLSKHASKCVRYVMW
jgi:hypothetical protein